tara:strand:- start:2347 stop:2754 length:408 start_codon:yes stop_codon:yes gene_type:complete
VIDLSTAQKIIEGAQKKSKELSANFCISIVDPRGDLILFVREDEAPWRSIFISQGKAAASAAFMQSSGKLAEGGPNPIHQGLMAMLGGRMIPGQGGLPVYKDGVIIGAVGVSGGTPQEDEIIASAGITFAGMTLY